MKPLRYPEEFFECLQKGMQKYFDRHNQTWGGIMHLTVGVRYGKVGGIIKRDDAFVRYEGYMPTHVYNVISHALSAYGLPLKDVTGILALVRRELIGAPEEQPTEEQPTEEQPQTHNS